MPTDSVALSFAYYESQNVPGRGAIHLFKSVPWQIFTPVALKPSTAQDVFFRSVSTLPRFYLI